MLSAFARRSLLSSALAHRLAATSAPARGIVRLQSAALCLQDVERSDSQPQQIAAELPQASEPFGFRVKFAEVSQKNTKLRLDTYLSARLPDVSRSQLQHGIKLGLVTVNGKVHVQSHKNVRPGDVVLCSLPPPPVTTAIPQDIPLDIVFEDDHLLVINKAAGMVVHPAPGNLTGTLVNAVLHHCNLPEYELPPEQGPQTLSPWPDPQGPTGDEVYSEDEAFDALEPPPQPVSSSSQSGLLRPGVVHRLDKGTTGLIVMAKDAKTQWHLSDQFKAHTVERTYWSIVVKLPAGPKGIVETKIARHPKDRKRMAPMPVHFTKGRYAKSTFQLLEALPDANVALVQWNLSTGRTHQIRVHAQHIGHPLFGDADYGGAGGASLFALSGNNTPRRFRVAELVQALGRPALHAKSLGFTHPITRERLQFTSDLPPDFQGVLEELRGISELGNIERKVARQKGWRQRGKLVHSRR